MRITNKDSATPEVCSLRVSNYDTILFKPGFYVKILAWPLRICENFLLHWWRKNVHISVSWRPKDAKLLAVALEQKIPNNSSSVIISLILYTLSSALVLAMLLSSNSLVGTSSSIHLVVRLEWLHHDGVICQYCNTSRSSCVRLPFLFTKTPLDSHHIIQLHTMVLFQISWPDSQWKQKQGKMFQYCRAKVE